MLGSVIVEEVGLVDNVSDLENRARAKPSHPVFLPFFICIFFSPPKAT